jgi:P-type Ca2+ transporter type 2C
MEKGDPDVMKRPPRPKHEPIINESMRLGIIIQTIMQTSATLGAFLIGLTWLVQNSDSCGCERLLVPAAS